MVTFSRQRRIWSFHVAFLQRTAKKCTKNYNARAHLLFCSSNLLFCGVLVAVAVVFCVRSLLLKLPNNFTTAKVVWIAAMISDVFIKVLESENKSPKVEIIAEWDKSYSKSFIFPVARLSTYALLIFWVSSWSKVTYVTAISHKPSLESACAPTEVCRIRFLILVRWAGIEIKVAMSYSTWKMDRLQTVTILMPPTWGFNRKVKMVWYP